MRGTINFSHVITRADGSTYNVQGKDCKILKLPNGKYELSVLTGKRGKPPKIIVDSLHEVGTATEIAPAPIKAPKPAIVRPKPVQARILPAAPIPANIPYASITEGTTIAEPLFSPPAIETSACADIALELLANAGSAW